MHNFEKTHIDKNLRYIKKCVQHIFLMYLNFFINAGLLKHMHNGYSLDVEFNSTASERLNVKFKHAI